MTTCLRIPPATVRRLWLDTSIRTEDAAAELGITRQGLSDMARRLGLPSRAKNYGLQKRGSDADFRHMWLAGVSVEDLARHFGYVDHRGVCQRRRMMGLPARTRGGKGRGRRWKETISLSEYRERQIAARMDAVAAAERAQMRLAEMVDGRATTGRWS